MNILYLEDNLCDFELISDIIHEMYTNCNIIHANNCSDFLKQLTENDFEIILADYDGFTALAQTKEQVPDTPFIIITGVLKEESAINSLKQGATDFVSKNHITHQLVPAIERALRETKIRLQQKELETKLVDLENKINDHEELYQRLTKRVRGFLRIELPTCKYSLVDNFLEELSGYPLEKWFNTPNFLYEIIHPEFRDYFSINSNKMKEGLVPKVLEYKIIRQDGEERWWLQFNIGAYNIDRILVSVSSVIIDNTENKEREIKYQNLFENVIGGIFRTDIETGLIIEANQKLVETMGYKSKEEVRNKVRSIDYYYHPDQREVVLNELRTKGIIEDYEFLLKNSDGTPVWVSLSAKLYPKDGYIEGIIIDITKRKLAEEKLTIEKNKTKKYLDIAGCIIVVIDNNQNVILINMKGCETLGYTEEEITGKNWIENFLPQRIRDGVRDTFGRAIKEGISQKDNFINFILTKSGEERIISWHNTYLKDSHGDVEAIVSSGEDITERWEIEQR